MKLLVIGYEGQIARSLREACVGREDILVESVGRPLVDLLRPGSVAGAIVKCRPDIVVNAAAYTAVDKAEDEPDLAFAINRDGAQEVAAAAADQGLPIVHFSTDYVFDGKKLGFYDETDRPNPQNVYGRSKLEGERAVVAVNPQHIILRTSWVYAPFGLNFVRTVWRKLGEGQRLSIVNDQSGCPSYAPAIADATVTLASRLLKGGWKSGYEGVTNLAGPDDVTWYDFACLIAERHAASGGRLGDIVPIAASDYAARALRPANSRLSTVRLQSVFDIRLPHLKTSLEDCLDRIRKDTGGLP